MARMSRSFWGVMVVVALVLFSGYGTAEAAKPHNGSCVECHKSGLNPRGMSGLCALCHVSGKVAENNGTFGANAASNALGSNLTVVPGAGSETSHFWGGMKTLKADAGSTTPLSTFYVSRYGISTGLVTCSICHDPHLDTVAKPRLLRAAAAGDLICNACHKPFYQNQPDALLSHPIVADYAAFAADDRFKPKPIVNAAGGDVRLVVGIGGTEGVYCTSCHATHFADSKSSAIADTKENYLAGTLAVGDGKLLRADGPLRTGGATRGEAITGTAQLRSNLCQACHKYKLHGVSSGPNRIGCLDCHGGHSYNNNNPSDYVLSDRSPDAVPIRLNKVPAPGSPAVVTYPNFRAATPSRLSWSDDVKGGANPGFCEKCHGDVQDDAVGSVGLLDTAHLAGAVQQCDYCHKHDDLLYSFAKDANAGTCGQCHGFPPYLNVRGDSGNDPDGIGPNPPLGTLGGYGYNYLDLPAYDYVTSTTYEKDESKTAHKTHAGYNLPEVEAPNWYFVGKSGIENCQPCHGSGAGSLNHRVNNTETFRDVPFSTVAYLPVASPPTPVYNTSTFVCTNTYCHSNGGIRNATGTKVAGDFKLIASPFWVGTGLSYAGGGFGSITVASPCSQCHGNTVATMHLTTGKKNSQAHNTHLGSGSMTKVYGCEVCHSKVAASATTLAPNATNGQQWATGGGKHVNGAVDVDYKTSGSPLYVQLLANGADTTYNLTTGACANYCHDPDNLGTVVDWDSVTVMQCDSCHGGLSTDLAPGFGPISTGSHPAHVTAANGPKLACSVCHGTNDGKHATHLNGVSIGDYTAGVCETCHGYTNTLGETLPVWGATPYADANPLQRDGRYCVACHTGVVTPILGSGGIAAGAPAKANALTTGHGLASGNYPLSLKTAANRTCTACHDSNAAGHFDGITGDDKRLLLNSNGFPVAYSTVTDKNNHCGACHATTPGHSLPSTLRGLNTHQLKACIACHDPHGDSNRAMVLTSQTTQNAKDTVGTGKYFANVTFTALIGAFSFDEDEGAAGNPGEINNNDICATCHTTTGGSAHNNNQNLPTTVSTNHNQGSNCLSSCHFAHNNPVDTNAFGGGAGADCNGCHGYPPATGDSRHTAAKIGAHELHSSSALPVGGAEASDCELCHPGATGYTLTLGGTHGDGALGGATTMVGGMAGGTATCTNSCHLSTATVDGYWTDTNKAGYAGNGLNCNACHYAAQAPSGANNIAAGTKQVSATHNEHFNNTNSRTCAQCHDVSYTDAALTGIPGGAYPGLIHITTPGSGAGTAAWYQNRAAAALDEAAVTSTLRPTMTYSAGVADAAGANNRCAGGGIALGCHATGTPDWDVAIPATSAGCVMCHTGTSVSTVDPTSSLHAVVPTVTGKQHAGSFTYNAGANTADCITCHTTPTIVAADHINGTFDATIGAAGNTKIFLAATVGFVDAVVPTCNVSTVGCHTAKTAPQSRSWLYKWHNNGAATTGKQCDGCHGMWADLAYGSGGWNTNVIAHRDASEAETYHGTGATYKCRDCHGLESASGYPFSTTNNDWRPNAGELGTTLHGDGAINVNTNGGATFSRTPFSGCTSACHLNTDGVAAGQHGYTVTTWGYTTITGDAIVSNCYSCHGGGTANSGSGYNYWPDGTVYPDKKGGASATGRHATHIAKLAVQLGISLATVTDPQQKRMCAYCHNDPLANGANGHETNESARTPLGIADVGDINAQWAAGDPPSPADAGATFSTAVDGTCSGIDCHNNVATTAGTYGWNNDPLSTCAMCHTTGASDVTHLAHTTAAGMGTIDCLKCHGDGTTTTTAPTLGHLDGTLTVVGTVINGTTVTYSGGLTGTCSVNICHTSGRYSAGVLQPPKTVSYPWGTPIAGCNACHETTNALTSGTTGSHIAHLTTTSQAMTCDSCHTAGTVATHLDGNINFIASVPYNGGVSEPMSAATEAFKTCATNVCHTSGRFSSPAPYNNGLGSYTWGTAIGGVNSCTECHNNAALGELHSNHMGAATLFGMTTVTCDSCHGAGAALGTHSGHVEATIALVAGMNYSGTPGSVNVTTSTFGTCNTTTCHNNGLAAAVLTPAWNDASSTGDDCTLCHGNAGANLNSKAHPIHIATSVQSGKAWGPYPTAGSTNCGECHASPANNSSMATYATHINGANDFKTGGTLAATTSCDLCHGGTTAATTAKFNWTSTPTRVSCESCHGVIPAVIGRSAPVNAGASYTTYGHNKVTNNPTYGGKACADCHDIAAAGHIGGTLGDKRMKQVNSQTYSAATNNFCASACHTGAVENFHFANSNTPGGTSSDALLCMTCHNPHGQNGDQDAMIRSTIAGNPVAGFTSKTTRASYYQAGPGFNGVCQACHDPADGVGHFNRNTNDTAHKSPQVCTDCHTHTSSPAFKASGCDGCHGYPPVQRLGVGTAAEFYLYAGLEDYQGGGRAHAVVGHLNPTGLDPSDGWTPCAPCHTEVANHDALGIANLPTQRDVSGNWGNEATRHPRVNLGGTGTYMMGLRNTTVGMGYCSNSSCHYSTSPKWDCLPASTTNDPQ